MTDFRAELQALIDAYDKHGGRWPQEHEEALSDAVERARAALSTQPPAPPQPIPVSERTPEGEDCDGKGRCWLHCANSVFLGAVWCLASADLRGTWTSHWLPADALPLPSVGGES